jgi:hypothetical protein
MNTSWNRGVESPVGFIMSYAQREYNSIRTHIKDMTNFVNLRLLMPITDLYFSWIIPSMVLDTDNNDEFLVSDDFFE